MKQTIKFTDFVGAFRQDDRNNFFYHALELLFNYLEDCNPDYELDVIALCCEYSESTHEEVASSYSIQGDILTYLNYHTSVIGVTDADSIVYAQF